MTAVHMSPSRGGWAGVGHPPFTHLVVLHQLTDPPVHPLGHSLSSSLGGILSQVLGAAETPTLGSKFEEPGGEAGLGPQGTEVGLLLEVRSGELALV